jgi:WD40 repeat protein
VRLLLGLRELSGETTLADLGVEGAAELTLVRTRLPLALTISCHSKKEIWDCRTGECLKSWQNHPEYTVTCASFSQDYALILAGCDDRAARLWSCDTGACLQVFRGHALSVVSAAFSPDGALS